MQRMRFTVALLQLAAGLFVLLLFTGSAGLASAFVWLLLLALPVFLLEALLTLCGAASFFAGPK
jgi:hypothetical protein